jgi:hypothetical protein
MFGPLNFSIEEECDILVIPYAFPRSIETPTRNAEGQESDAQDKEDTKGKKKTSIERE